MAGGNSPRELDQTPTWALAAVCAVIVLISIVLEKLLHRVGEAFQEKHSKALFEALEKIKAELMILGFISLLLTFCQSYISKVCIPISAADTMLPCHAHWQPHSEKHKPDHEPEKGGEPSHRRLLWLQRRYLATHIAAGCDESKGPAKIPRKPVSLIICWDFFLGHVPLISKNGLHQLHIFIFFLAVFHVIYSCITMMLGRLKIRKWKTWEKETAHEYEISNDPSRFRLTHETSFVKDHTSFWTTKPVLFYIVCFFRQFFRSVRRADYLTMRHGFISVHLAPGSKFDFQKYIKRSLEDDFKVVVGISPVLWGSSVIFLLLNVHGWQAIFWATIIPLLLILAVGTKLEGIITMMAVEIQERHAVVQGIPLVQVSDKHFWFSRPELILQLIHFTLFQNAFQITYFFWIWYEFGIRSCFNDNLNLLIIRVIIGVVVQFLCSYITLPLYALVTQMGSNMKRSIFDEQTSKALKKWHMNALKKKPGATATRTLGGSPCSSPLNSSSDLLPRFNNDQGLSAHEMEEIALTPRQKTKGDLLGDP